MASTQAGDMPPELWSIRYSPWSLKAKWALQHCGARYTVVKYRIPQSEWALRLKLRRWHVTVPALIGKGLALMDSYDIAKYADDRRPPGQDSLFCPGVDAWTRLAEEIAVQERARSLIELRNDPARVRLCIPSSLTWLGPIAPSIVRWCMDMFIRKFGVTQYDESVTRRNLDKVYEALLTKDGGTQMYLLEDRLTWADMSVVFALQLIKVAPQLRKDQTFPLPDDMTNEKLVREFPGLLRWRDAVLEKHWPEVK